MESLWWVELLEGMGHEISPVIGSGKDLFNKLGQGRLADLQALDRGRWRGFP